MAAARRSSHPDLHLHGAGRERVEAFVAPDAYYVNGLVTGYRIERWSLRRGH